MKATLYLLSLILICLTACKHEDVDAEHQKKAEQIMQRLFSGKQLPPEIKSYPRETSHPYFKHNFTFSYKGKRMVNGIQCDTVPISVSLNDSIRYMQFDETYAVLNDSLVNYHFCIENGKITYAYNDKWLPESQQLPPDTMEDGSILYPFNSAVDSSLIIGNGDTTVWIDPVKKEKQLQRERNALPFYLPKLYYSIDELYDLLFK